MPKTFDHKRWAKEALLVQDACNLSGVVHSFAQMLSEMVEAGMDTKERAEHACTIMFADKIVDLTIGRYDTGTLFHRAYEWARRTAEGT